MQVLFYLWSIPKSNLGHKLKTKWKRVVSEYCDLPSKHYFVNS